MWERIFVILRKEFIQALREPRMRVLLFVPPMVQLIVFGFAAVIILPSLALLYTLDQKSLLADDDTDQLSSAS